MGGGGFAMEPDNLLLDRYLLSLADKSTPKVCFVGTASGDSERYHDKFYSSYRTLLCVPSHLSLFKPHTEDIEGFILEQDIIHVGGGNTRNLLILWKEWGLDHVLQKAYSNGVVLSGMSAGMICWFEEFTTDSFGEELRKLSGLGWLKGSAVPHFDGEAKRLPTYLGMIERGEILGGVALDDGVGALYLDESLKECVSSRSSAKGYRLEKHGNAVHQETMQTRFLGR